MTHQRMITAQRAVAWTLVLLIGAIGLLGFVSSFADVARAARLGFGGLSWMVPVWLGVGIVVVTFFAARSAQLELRSWWLGLVRWSLIVTVVYLSAAEPIRHGDVVGAAAYGSRPLLWVVAVEIAALVWCVHRHRRLAVRPIAAALVRTCGPPPCDRDEATAPEPPSRLTRVVWRWLR
jgi:hypothetical protein